MYIRKLEQDYAFKETISTDSMTSDVFLYEQKSLKCLRVVKLLQRKFVENVAKKRDVLGVKSSFGADFAAEIALLAALTHRNLVMILDAGEEDGRPYYIMEHVAGGRNIVQYLQDVSVPPSAVFGLTRQVLEGLAWLHSNSVLHMDIKPENILVQPAGPTVKITDLGFARTWQGPQTENLLVKGTRGYWPDAFVKQVDRFGDVEDELASNSHASTLVLGYCQRQRLNPQIDLCALGKTLIEICGTLRADEKTEPETRGFLRAFASDLARGDYESVDEALRHYNKRTAEGPFPEARHLPVKSIRVPELMAVPFSTRVKMVVDDPLFRRLANIKQLALVHYVYPGAVHSRLEHSLGAYTKSIRYLLALWENSDTFRRQVTREHMEAAMGAALLHDIGHYPFAHVIEELLPIAEFPELENHNEFSRKIICNDTALVNALHGLPGAEKIITGANLTLQRTLWTHWGEDVCSIMARLVSTPVHQREKLTPIEQVLSQILSGPLDCDKFDYLLRDGLHAGVPYARSLDEGRILSSLEMIKRPDGMYVLGVTHKARAAVELMVFVRYIMFTEVYWHHAVRIAMRMLQLVFERAVGLASTKERRTLLGILLMHGEHEFLAWLKEACTGTAEGSEVLGMFERRLLYKRLETLSAHGRTAEAYKAYVSEEAKAWLPQNREVVEEEVVKGINSCLRVDRLRGHDVLLDLPRPRPGDEVSGIFMVSPEELAPVDLLERDYVLETFGQDFINHAKKVRFLIHPDKEAAVARLKVKGPDGKSVLDKIVENAVKSLKTRSAARTGAPGTGGRT